VSPLEAEPVPVDAGALETAAGVDEAAAEAAEDSTALEDTETVAKIPPDEAEVGVGFESEGTE